jgi:CPA1 family monovalent cation:H+ antiporter
VKFTGIGRPAAGARHEETIARLRLAEAGLARLDELADDGAASDAVIDRLRDGLQARIGRGRALMETGADAAPAALNEQQVRHELIAAEHAELSRLYRSGTISESTRSQLQRALDLETTRLSDGQR